MGLKLFEKQDDVKDNESHELSKQMDKELSLTRSILRIIIGFVAMLIWVL